jgi:DNA-binding NarL/FixJ family response regulator
MRVLVKIAIAEPSLIIRCGILSVLKRLRDLHIEALEISEIAQLKDALNRQKPDILMINPASLGWFSLQQIKKDVGNPQLKCIAIQCSLSDGNIIKVFDEVVSLYDSAEQIEEKLIRLIKDPKTDKHRESLSTREKEIIVCVIQGLTNKQIADKLCLSTHTVTTHRRNISAKLQIHSSAGLTIYAIVNKLVVLNDIQNFSEEHSDFEA